MVYFQTKISILGKFWTVLKLKVLVNFLAPWSVLRPFGLNYGHLVYFGFIWYIFPRFGMLYKEKSGNTGLPEKNVFPFFSVRYSQVRPPAARPEAGASAVKVSL
jgi:hypothetical protein